MLIVPTWKSTIKLGEKGIMDIIFTVALNAMTLISILMLVGLGLGIIYGLMGVINLSHGEFITIGAFCLAFIQGLGGSFWLALIIAPLIGGFIGFLIERSIIRHLYTRPLSTIMATWGLSLIIQQSLILIFGASPQKVSTPIADTILIFGANYPVYRLVLIGLATFIMVAASTGK